MLALVALGIALGRWQDRRAAEKEAIAAQLATGTGAAPIELGPEPRSTAPLMYHRVRVTGTFVRDWPIYLDNRPHDGRAGFVVLMPFQVEGSPMHVLVARGWIPRDPSDRTRIAPYPTPTGTVTVEGVAKPGAGHVWQLGQPQAPTAGAIVQNVDLDDAMRTLQRPLHYLVLEQTSRDGSEGALVRDWPKADLGIDKHRGYAFQWYALALMAFLFFLFTGLRSGSKQNPKPNR
ncbi:cytochrome oxidase assembly protein ShyY1 [Pseudoduganella flava]|nr:cytochrome oxidase assembly protein ShyY1 [Pseudoduganella flava]